VTLHPRLSRRAPRALRVSCALSQRIRRTWRMWPMMLVFPVRQDGGSPKTTPVPWWVW